MSRSRQAGFTLPELIVVVLVTSTLLIAALAWLHPKDTGPVNRNAQRQLDTAHLIQALKRYAADHEGALPEGITDKTTIMGTQPNEINFCRSLVPAYLADMPTDPATGGEVKLEGSDCTNENVYYSTGYTIVRSKDGTVTIAAPDAEEGQHIKTDYKF